MLIWKSGRSTKPVQSVQYHPIWLKRITAFSLTLTMPTIATVTKALRKDLWTHLVWVTLAWSLKYLKYHVQPGIPGTAN